jgi:hypothetical protein
MRYDRGFPQRRLASLASPVYVGGLLVDVVALGQGFLRLLTPFHVSIITPMLHNTIFVICHRRCEVLEAGSVVKHTTRTYISPLTPQHFYTSSCPTP